MALCLMSVVHEARDDLFLEILSILKNLVLTVLNLYTVLQGRIGGRLSASKVVSGQRRRQQHKQFAEITKVVDNIQ
jgi:hypothetical protein